MGKRHTIIILDDDISVCETVKIALSALFDVEYFISAPAFKSYMLEKKPISLLILDFKIADVNGIQFYREELAQYKIPTMLISGFIGQNKTDEELSELKKDFIAILEKPFDIFELIKNIETVLSCE